MEIDDPGLPIHEDATAKIRPRIFLEGNFFVDLKPGTPDAPVLDSGETIKITQTATPVQLDQVLTSLQSDSREDLTALLDGLATALNSKPTPAQDRDNHELAKGQSAAESFNDAYDDIPDAERSSAIVFEALLGTEPGRDVRAADPRDRQHRRRAEPLREPAPGPDHEPQPDDGGVRVGVHEPARVDPRAGADAAQRQRAFDSLNAAFPSTRAFATEIRPGVRETPATIEAAFPWIEQTRALVGEDELGRPGRGALARHRRPGAADRPRVRAAAADRPRRPSACATSSCPPATS